MHRAYPDGQADRLGVPPKVVVLSVGTTKIKDLTEFEEAVMAVKVPSVAVVLRSSRWESLVVVSSRW